MATHDRSDKTANDRTNFHVSSLERHTHLPRDLKEFAAGFLLLPITIALTYAPVLLGDKSLLTDTPAVNPYLVADAAAGGNVTQQKQLAVLAAWQHGHLPIWFPYEGYGVTLAGNQAAPWFAPELAVHLLFPHNLSLWPLVAQYLGALGMFLLLRALRRSLTASLLGGLLYVLTGPFIANLNLDMINTLVIAPYLAMSILYATRTSRPRTYKWIAVYSFLLSQLFLAGFAETVPLLLISAAVFGTASYFTCSPSERTRLNVLVPLLALGTLAALAASSIATYSLIQVLFTNYTFQPKQGYLITSPPSLLITLVDPWYFGRAVYRGDITQSLWAYGNLFAIPLAALTAYGQFRPGLPGRNPLRGIVFAEMALTAFGLLAFTNTFHVLAIFDLPLLRQIIAIRFMPFMWWLPLCMLAAFGIDQALASKTHTLFTFALLTPVLYDLWNSLISPTTASSRTNIYIWLLMTGGIVAFLLNPRHRRYLLPLAILGSMEIMLPRGYFPSVQVTNTRLPFQNILKRMPTAIAISPKTLFLPSALASHNYRTIQAFDVLLPKPYVATLQRYFGSAPPSDPASPIWSEQPTLSNLPLNTTTITALSVMGVNLVIAPTPLSLQPTQPSLVKYSTQRLSNTEITGLTALVEAYFKAAPLQKQYVLTGRSIPLLRWAITASRTSPHDNNALTPFQHVFPDVLNAEVHNERLNAFAPIASDQYSLRLLGKSRFFGASEYIYSLDGNVSSSLLWAPDRIMPAQPKSVEGITARSIVWVDGDHLPVLNYLSQGEPAQLLSFRQTSENFSAIVKSSSRQLIVFRQEYPAGSTAKVNGRPVKIITADGMFASLVVPKGQSLITFDYVSAPILWLFWLSVTLNCATMCAIAATGLLETRRAHS